MSENRSLPSYRKPPVIEVVCGVQFEAISKFASIHIGKFADRVHEEYPHVEDREPLAEIFEGEQGTETRADVIALTLPPLRRVFYVTNDGNNLLQLQPSRFLANWRKQQQQDEYPHFEAAYDRFRGGWTRLLAFLKEEDLGTPKVNQYELTYINHVLEAATLFPEGMQEHLGLFAWRNAQSMKFLPAPKAASFRLHFPLPDQRGTLHVTISHGTRAADNKGVLILDLTARGKGRPDWSDMEPWFTMAHEWIVRGFTDLTTPEAHIRWEREK